MKKILKAIRIVTAMSAVLLTIILNCQRKDIISSQEARSESHSAVISQQKEQHHDANLTDATLLYRICSSRPQRIIPVHSSRNHRTTNPFSCFARRNIVKLLHSVLKGRKNTRIALFCHTASCDYYIALRHIIR